MSTDEFKSATKYVFLSTDDQHELLISGYNKEIELSNKSLIPSDIYNLIYQYYVFRVVKLIFCDQNGFIDETKYICRAVLDNIKLIQISTTLQIELFNKENNSLPDIHLWMKFKDMKNCFLIDKRYALVSEADLSAINPEKWMEIPNDYARHKELTNFGDLCVAIETKQQDKTWPRAKFKNNIEWNKIETGDFVDCKDEQFQDTGNWFESWVRCVNPKVDPKESGFSNFIVIHYIGWNIKWDEPVKLPQSMSFDAESRIAVRNNHASGPHLPFLKFYSTNEYRINVIVNQNEQREILIKPIEEFEDGRYSNVPKYRHEFESFQQSLRNDLDVEHEDNIKLKCVTGFVPNTVEHVRHLLPYYLGNWELIDPLSN